MAKDKPVAEMNPVQMTLANALIWKLVVDEMGATNPNAIKSLNANLEHIITFLRSDEKAASIADVAPVLELYHAVLKNSDVAAALNEYEKFQHGKVH